MKIIKTIPGIKIEIKKQREQGRTIGFVPTMGALHQGHLSLVKACQKENDITVVSIFVNPAQFGPNEDFEKYPRDFQKDEHMLDELGVDIIFYPTKDEIYPLGYAAYVNVEKLDQVLCGKSRPTHFKGVATVVLKLFNIIKPDNAYFGRKDAQQAILLKKMVIDLNLDVGLKALPIIRDDDGLALSSRNVYLSKEEREAALNMPRALMQMEKQIRGGLLDATAIKAGIEAQLKKSPLIIIDYVEVVTLDRLEHFQKNSQDQEQHIELKNTLVAVAIKVGKTRLIDNIILGEI
ncbi:MAG: pantoate--beta-alanine ligase [Acidobacteria bacterium]|jgi:pantoate--beta-alanine ligase|nr:pantoate--beta-alanine ligase [Acidobacteriota bacterium]